MRTLPDAGSAVRVLNPVCVAFATLLLLAGAAACDDSGADQQPPSSTQVPVATPAPTAPVIAPNLTPATVTSVVDGDTIDVEIHGVEYRVRYIGIDTPETVDPRRPVGCFGEEASARNAELVGGRSVGLEKDVSDTDAFGRLLRYVWVAGDSEPRMVNATLVAEGYALAVTFPPDVRYSEMFADLQREARDAGRGLWGPICETPVPTAIPGSIDGACEYSATDEPVIKGNISSSSGEKIYHVPGQRYYDQTVIDESKGERWFCTEQEAIEAGWRKAKV